MKKAFLLTITFLLIISLTNIANADQLQMDNEWDTGIYTCDIEMDADKKIYCIGTYDNVEVRKYDDSRNLIYSTELPDYYFGDSISVDNDKNAYIICDTDQYYFTDLEHNINGSNVINVLLQSHLLKLDTNGDILFDISLNGDNLNNKSSFRGVKIYNNYLYVIGDREIYKNYIRTEGDKNYYNYERKAFLLKIDFEGNIISETILGDIIKQNEIAFYNDSATSGAYRPHKGCF